MNIYLVGTSTIVNLPHPELCEHVLFSKYAYPKKCFAWFVERKKAEVTPSRCPFVEDAMKRPPRICGRLLKKGRTGFCNKHTRILKEKKK